MTAAVRALPPIPAFDEREPTDAERLDLMTKHVHDVIAKNAQLTRDLTSARSRNATLRRELVRMVTAPTVVGSHVVDGMLTLTLSTGAVIQRRPHVIDTADEFAYTFRWEALAPPTDTKAAVADDVFADEGNLPAELYGLAQSVGARAERQHHDPTFRTLAELALRGMAVSTGDEP